jgi:hypothetical protein
MGLLLVRFVRHKQCGVSADHQDDHRNELLTQGPPLLTTRKMTQKEDIVLR